jgi:hypothetical protein
MEGTPEDLKISYVCIGKQISHKEENTEDIFFVFHDATLHSFIIFKRYLNPILHTTWLNNHALTLPTYDAKYCFVKNPVFCIPS